MPFIAIRYSVPKPKKIPAQNASTLTTMLLANMLIERTEEGMILKMPSVQRCPCSTCSIMSSLANKAISVGNVSISHQPASALIAMSNAMLKIRARNSRAAPGMSMLSRPRIAATPPRGLRLISPCNWP